MNRITSDKRRGNKRMDQNKVKDSPSQHEIDPFTAFMFGKPRFKDEPVQSEKKPQELFSTNDWLFGRKNREDSQTEEPNVKTFFNQYLSQMDMEEMMKNVEVLIETVQEFKPLWKKLSPFIHKWIK